MMDEFVLNQTFYLTNTTDRDCATLCANNDNSNFSTPVYNDTLSPNVYNDTLPPNLLFNENSLTSVIIYCILFVLAAVGNLTVFITLFRSRHRKSRINLMITHLAVADLMVTFIMIPLEIGWRVTVQWIAGNIACKIFLFLRAFGLYLSSNVLVCISLDRYFAVLHPLRVNDARRRGKVMLSIAWSVSLCYALPQSVVFHVQKHPVYPAFQQCVTFGFFSSMGYEVAYNLFCVFAMYFIPLFIISSAYLAILCEIWKKSRESRGENKCENGQVHLRRSDVSNIERARTRTLRMTASIVAAFVFCWTPYVVMTLWYMFDRESARRVDGRLQDALFMMAVSNSCMNPLVYGSYAINLRRECRNFLCCMKSSMHQKNRYNTNQLNSTVIQTENGVQRGLVRRILKSMLTFKKGVGSVATRSTAMHGNKINSPRPNNVVIKKKMSRNESPNFELNSFISEPVVGHPMRPVFNSDPTGDNITYFFPEQATSHSLDCTFPR